MAGSGKRLPPPAACALLLVACVTVQERKDFISTAQYGLEATYYPLKIAKPSASGGGIALIDDQALLVTGEGDFHLFRWNEPSGEFELRPLPYRVPINREEFVAVHGVNWESFRFRVSDVLIQPRGEAVKILASHHFWKASESAMWSGCRLAATAWTNS